MMPTQLRQSIDTVEKLLLKAAALILVITLQSEVGAHCDRALRPKTGADQLHVLEASNHQPGCDQQNEAHCQLRDDEAIPEPRSPEPRP